jgi:hypothetical protein
MNIASIKPTEHIKNVNKIKDKALAHMKKTVQGTYITEKDTKKAKKIKDSDKKSVIFVTN